MQHLEVSCAVRPIYKWLGFKGLISSKKLWFWFTFTNFTFVGPCIVSVFKQDQQDATLHNATHVSGSSYAHHQELKTVYTASGICRAFSASCRYRE